MKSVLWSLIFFGAITYSTFAATTRTTARPSSQRVNTTAKNRKISHGILSRMGAGNSSTNTGSRQVITTRLGTDGVTPQEQCQCVLFYLCNQNDVLELSPSGVQCSIQTQVCCLLPYPDLGGSDSSNQSTVPPNSFLPTTTSPLSGSSSGSFQNTSTTDPFAFVSPTGSTVVSPNACLCVPQSRCLNSTDPVSGAGNIDVRIPLCGTQEICCYPTDIVGGNTPETGGSIPVAESSSQSTVWSESTSPLEQNTSSQSTTSIPVSLPSSDQCGTRNMGIINRIVGQEASRNTTFGEFPWMAIILTAENSDGERKDNLFVCGASLVAPNIVLTAAHCVYQRDPALLKIRVGEYDTSISSLSELAPHQDRRVSHIYIHPQYNSKALYNDVAFITTEQTFNQSTHIAPICIPLMNTEMVGENVYDSRQCVATGWGKEAFGPDELYATTLKKVDLSLMPNDQCQQQLRGTRLGPYFVLDTSFICAGGQRGFDTCEGDGGGPLVCALRSNPNRYIQVGIVSWGIGCGDHVPAVYASLLNNINWVTEQYTVLTTFTEQSFDNNILRRRS